MIELLAGVLLICVLTGVSFFMLWRKERDKRKAIEKKVRAHELLQEIDDDIANGGDEYVAEQLLKYTRNV